MRGKGESTLFVAVVCHAFLSPFSYNMLLTGNFTTLDVDPKSRGLDTREELIALYEKSYSANLMHLVVYGKGIQGFSLFLEFLCIY